MFAHCEDPIAGLSSTVAAFCNGQQTSKQPGPWHKIASNEHNNKYSTSRRALHGVTLWDTLHAETLDSRCFLFKPQPVQFVLKMGWGHVAVRIPGSQSGAFRKPRRIRKPETDQSQSLRRIFRQQQARR